VPGERWHRERLDRLAKELPAADLAYAAALTSPPERPPQEIAEWRLAVACARRIDREDGGRCARPPASSTPMGTPYLPGPDAA
jgi:hypothetical protein